jgi:hypothetical protein
MRHRSRNGTPITVRKIVTISAVLMGVASYSFGQTTEISRRRTFPPEERCADCGPCGLAGGLNDKDRIVYDVGTDPDGALVIELTRWKKGQCTSAGSRSFWVRFGAGRTSLVPKPEGAQLDRARVKLGPTGLPGATYLMKDSDHISVVLTRVADDVHLSFMNGTESIESRCTLAEDPQSVICDAHK